MLLKGNTKRVVKIIAGLKAEGIVPVVVNWALTKDIRLLTQARPGTGFCRLSAEAFWRVAEPDRTV